VFSPVQPALSRSCGKFRYVVVSLSRPQKSQISSSTCPGALKLQNEHTAAPIAPVNKHANCAVFYNGYSSSSRTHQLCQRGNLDSCKAALKMQTPKEEALEPNQAIPTAHGARTWRVNGYLALVSICTAEQQPLQQVRDNQCAVYAALELARS